MRNSKSLLVYFIVLCTGLALAAPTTAIGKVMKVVGQNDPAVDVAAVQDAVDSNGSVRLEGTFDFGEDGSVTLTQSVQIRGQADNQGNPLTTIKGGDKTFYCDDTDVSIKISQICFDGAKFCAIRVRQCDVLEISDNKFINLVGGLNYGERGDPYYDAVGAIIGGKRIESQNGRNIYCRNITVSDNYFDCGAYDENGQLINRDVGLLPETSRGLRLYHCVVENAYITGNEIINVNRICIDVLDASGTPDLTADIYIEQNDVSTGPYAARGGWSASEIVGSSYGMHCLCGFAHPEAIYTRFHVNHNNITVWATNPWAYAAGIYMLPGTSFAEVSFNTFNLGENAAGGIYVMWVYGMASPLANQPHNNVISNNQFIGTVTPAIMSLSPLRILPGAAVGMGSTHSNAILGNNFDNLIPIPKQMGGMILPAAHVIFTGYDLANGVFPARDNVLVGGGGFVIDGTDNPLTPEYDGLNSIKGDFNIQTEGGVGYDLTEIIKASKDF
ncbi:MAG: hypothetical protein HF978_00410 [Desulfobacteraceae bacterium]|nr:hypothetical protein [Desulfobacteraceae bacterium]MBC2753996.1 hypothetical protein [Desulfobacteraceae bacterium]